MNFVYFSVQKSGISVFLVSAENGAGVNKKTNITYVKFLLGGLVVQCNNIDERKLSRNMDKSEIESLPVPAQK